MGWREVGRITRDMSTNPPTGLRGIMPDPHGLLGLRFGGVTRPPTGITLTPHEDYAKGSPDLTGVNGTITPDPHWYYGKGSPSITLTLTAFLAHIKLNPHRGGKGPPLKGMVCKSAPPPHEKA